MRPPFAQERLRRRSDGRVALELKTAWHDGTRELVFEPLEFLEMPPLFGEARVVHDPGAPPMRAHGGQHRVPGDPQHGRVVPGGVGHEVMQRLMARPHSPRVDPGSQGFDAFRSPGR